MDQVYHLALRSALHVGSTGVGHEGTLTYMPSDTLFGALVSTWAWQGDAPALAARLAPFEAGQPPFLLTSAFPYAGAVRLYPRPETDPPVAEPTRQQLGKKLRGITHVSETILHRWLAGDTLDDTLVTDAGGVVLNFIQKARIWVTTAERNSIAATLELPADEPDLLQIWGENVVPHVSVDRISNAPNLFHTGRAYYASGCGLWFGVQWRDPAARPWLEEALSLMSDGGMGGLRSTGHGRFDWRREDAPGLPVPAVGDFAFLLSRTALAQTEMTALTAPASSYRLVTVGGWCGNEGEPPRKRRPVRLVAEGSVVQWSRDPLGRLVDVNPVRPEDALPHPVYRYGFGLGLRTGRGRLDVQG